MELTNIILPLSKLLLDPNNYRLDYARERKDYSEEEVVEAQNETSLRLEKEKLGGLRESIKQNGFLEMDRIVVRKLDAEGGLYLVVEGNRRVAAFKGLIEDYLKGNIEIPQLYEKSKAINVVAIEGSQNEIKKYAAGLMGVRHVSGPKAWSGYQSARLINDRHIEGDSFSNIGALLGISEMDAKRRFRNYRAFQQMKENKDFGEKILQKHYTLLSEFLSPTGGVRTWLGWVEDEENDVYEFQNTPNLERVYKAITSSDKKKAEITNVTTAREFIRCIESQPHRNSLEDGVRLEDLPPLHSDSISRVRLLQGFLSYLEEVNQEDVTHDEIELLKKIYQSSRLKKLSTKGTG